MVKITEIGLIKQANRFMDSISHVTVEILGEEKKITDIQKTIKDKKLYIFIFFDEFTEGEITKIKVFDNEGDLIDESDMKLTKTSERGVYVTFQYEYIGG